jgi:hypothetical protein
MEMNVDDILSAMDMQNATFLNAFNPEVIAFRNKVTELRKNCSMVEWDHDMGATIPYCKLDNSFCNGQCSFKTKDCPCNTEGR